MNSRQGSLDGVIYNTLNFGAVPLELRPRPLAPIPILTFDDRILEFSADEVAKR